jgi:BioD-like phosphotransacetylase family protein
MSAILIASLESGEGRTTAAAAIGALLGANGPARLLRLRGDGEDARAVEDDAATLAQVPGCTAPRSSVSEQDALSEARGEGVAVIEAPPGVSTELADRLDAKVVLVTSSSDDLRLGDLAAAAGALGARLAGVIALREHEKSVGRACGTIEERGLHCLGAVPEDRLLAGPTVREIAESLRASALYENGAMDEALEYVMLGPITSDPGQPYFYRHGRKAVVNRFDKMDLHLAALATEPECLVLTGGQMPSPYLMDRVANSNLELTVLLSPDGTVRTAELLTELYDHTRFRGTRKLERAIELFRANVSPGALKSLK